MNYEPSTKLEFDTHDKKPSKNYLVIAIASVLLLVVIVLGSCGGIVLFLNAQENARIEKEKKKIFERYLFLLGFYGFP